MRYSALLMLCVVITACNQQQPSLQDNALVPATMAQCGKDTDCKGERICEKGVCQAPISQAPETAASSPADPAVAASAEPELKVPQYTDYAVEIFTGPAGTLDISDETARTYKTRLTEAMQDKPAFAGEYTLMTMGCGSSGCISQIFVSRKTGRVLSQGFGSYSAFGVTDENGEDVRLGDTIEGMNADSRLLVVRHQYDPDEEDDKEEIKADVKFYVLEDGQLVLVKTVPLPDPVVKPYSYD